MREKRFYLGNNDTTICDRSQGGSDGFNMLTIFKVVDLLNEQQKEINELNQENADLLGDKIKSLDEFEKCTNKLKKKILEQQDTINLLLDLLYQSEETVINEYSSHIGEDMEELDKIFKEKDIKKIERFVRGCDDE